MKYTITGTVPQPMSRPELPPFVQHPDMARAERARPMPVGHSGRKVSVTTTSPEVGKILVSVFRSVYEKVQVKKEEG